MHIQHKDSPASPAPETGHPVAGRGVNLKSDSRFPWYVDVVPAIDILDGTVVRAVAGRREEYKPLESPYITSADPVDLVMKLSSLFGFRLFYLADLDSIMKTGSNKAIIEKLISQTGCHFWLDGGYERIGWFSRRQGMTPVVATETYLGWNENVDLGEMVLSIDVKGGSLLSPYPEMTIQSAIARARNAHARRFIYLRLDNVGTGDLDILNLPQPGVSEKWYAGGGVRGLDDLEKLSQAGYSGAIVSTALHNGSLA